MNNSHKWFNPNYVEQAQAVKRWNMIANGGEMRCGLDALELQANLITEEGKEVFAALATKSINDFAKELCDLFVVTSYMIYIESVFLEKGERGVNEDAVFSLDLQEGDRTPFRMLENLSEAVEQVWCAAILNNVIGLLTALDVDGKAILNSVIKNNFSKFSPVRVDEGVVVFDARCEELEEASEGRYKGVTWQLVEGYIIYRSSTGKILKPIGFKELVI